MCNEANDSEHRIEKTGISRRNVLRGAGTAAVGIAGVAGVSDSASAFEGDDIVAVAGQVDNFWKSDDNVLE